MEQNKDNFKNKLFFGQEGEKDIGLKLIEKGFYILPLYQFQDEIAPVRAVRTGAFLCVMIRDVIRRVPCTLSGI